MAVKISDELKNALILMSQKEKDKLLISLVSKDEFLVDKLTYEIVEEKTTLESRKEDVRKFISERIKMKNIYSNYDTNFYYENADIGGKISYFAKVTKDTLSEIELLVFYIKLAFIKYESEIGQYSRFENLIYKKIKKLVSLTKKIHADYLFSYKEDFEFIFLNANKSKSIKYEAKNDQIELEFDKLKTKQQ